MNESVGGQQKFFSFLIVSQAPRGEESRKVSRGSLLWVFPSQGAAPRAFSVATQTFRPRPIPAHHQKRKVYFQIVDSSHAFLHPLPLPKLLSYYTTLSHSHHLLFHLCCSNQKLHSRETIIFQRATQRQGNAKQKLVFLNFSCNSQYIKKFAC